MRGLRRTGAESSRAKRDVVNDRMARGEVKGWRAAALVSSMLPYLDIEALFEA